MMQRDYIALHTSIKKFVPVENIEIEDRNKYWIG